MPSIEGVVLALRKECEDCSEMSFNEQECRSLYYCPVRDAADLIESLTAERDELRGESQHWDSDCNTCPLSHFEACHEICHTKNRLMEFAADMAKDREHWKARAEALERIKAYWDSFYGQGLEIANWHMNGEIEPFDSFWESAEAEARFAGGKEDT